MIPIEDLTDVILAIEDADLYIIGAVCLSVCHKSHYFRIQRIWSFHTFIATFCTQRNWSFPCFLALSVFKGFGRFLCLYTLSVIKSVKKQYSKNLFKSPVFVHFPSSKVSRKSKTTKSLEVYKEFGQISCFWTLSVFKSVQKE